MKLKIPFLTRLLEIKEQQLIIEKIKINLLKEIRDGQVEIFNLMEK